jgi:DNA-binding transcriptional regulator YiaG
VPRDKYLPSRNRGIPIPRLPNTIGAHLRRRRLQLKIFQREAARRLGVSMRTLSRWECDKVYPTWPFQPRIVDYLGYDPFTDPALGRPRGNERRDVAFLSPDGPIPIGAALRKHRLHLRKSKTDFASHLGVSVKTLRDWEMNRRHPCRSHWDLILRFLEAR